MSSGSRKYAENIPSCLHERPHAFIKHIMTRLDDAMALRDQPDTYPVVLGQQPTCECKDYLRHTYPCKHIIKHWIDDNGDLHVPQLDLDPWVKMDTGNNVSRKLHHHSDCDPVQPGVRESSPVQTLRKIRSVLDQIRSWTYVTSSPEAIKQAYEGLLALKCGTGVSTLTQVGGIPVIPKGASTKKRPRVTSGGLKVKRRRPFTYRNTVKTLAECDTKSRTEGVTVANTPEDTCDTCSFTQTSEVVIVASPTKMSSFTCGRKIVQAARRMRRITRYVGLPCLISCCYVLFWVPV